METMAIIYSDASSARGKACTPGFFGCNNDPANCPYFTKKEALPVEPESFTGRQMKDWAEQLWY